MDNICSVRILYKNMMPKRVRKEYANSYTHNL